MPKPRESKNRVKPQYFFRLEKSGIVSGRQTYALMLAAKKLTVTANARGTVHKICDIDQTMPQEVECSGLNLKVKLVFKVYCRVPEKVLQRHRQQQWYEQLLKGRPAWTHD